MWLGADGSAQTPSGTSPDSSDWFSNLVTGLPTLATTIINGMNQQSLLDYNLTLINQGKAPLTPQQLISLQAGFTPGINVGVGQETLSTMTNLAIGGGLLIAGVFLFSQMSGGGKSRARARR